MLNRGLSGVGVDVCVWGGGGCIVLNRGLAGAGAAGVALCCSEDTKVLGSSVDRCIAICTALCCIMLHCQVWGGGRGGGGGVTLCCTEDTKVGDSSADWCIVFHICTCIMLYYVT